MTNSTGLRTVLGFLVAPVTPGLLVAALCAMFRIAEPTQTGWPILLSMMVGYPVALILGLPLYVFFRSHDGTRPGLYLASGSLMGILVYLISLLLGSSAAGSPGLVDRLMNTAPICIPLALTFGGMAALAFWVIARPDRAAAHGTRSHVESAARFRNSYPARG